MFPVTFCIFLRPSLGFPSGSVVKNLLSVQETQEMWVCYLGWEDPLEKGMATHSSIHSSVLAWRIPGTGEPGGLPSMGSHRVRHDWSNLAAAASIYAWRIPWTEEPGGLQSMGSQRVRHDWSDLACLHKPLGQPSQRSSIQALMPNLKSEQVTKIPGYWRKSHRKVKISKRKKELIENKNAENRWRL